MKTRTIFLLGCSALLVACVHEARVPGAAQASDAAGLLERYKAATGGVRWDAVESIESKGTLSMGGMSGEVTTLQDARSGRSVTRFTLGPIHAAQGFDGRTGWQQDPGGEVTALDAPEAREIARTEAWMNALGYWYPARGRAAFGPVAELEEAGRRLLLIEAKPAGGRAIVLGFDPATGLLVRTTQRQGADTVTTRLDDYRQAGGVRLPFHLVTDRTDAAGRTDPRNRSEVRLESVRVNVPVADAAFAMPAMAPGARIADPSGTTRIPFELENNHIYATATIDGQPVRVIVDTGGANVLTTAAAQRLGLATEGKLAASGVGDEKVDLALAHAGEIRLGGAVLARPVFYVIDLGPLPAAEGTEIDGLVGFEMFRRFRVTIDYDARRLTLTEPARFRPPPEAHVLPFEMSERIPIVAGTLDGLPVRLSIDTGSRASLSLHSPFVRAHDLVRRYRAAPETVVGWGVGGPSLGQPVRFGTLVLGDLAVRDLAGDLYLGDKGALADPDLSGNLGGGVLRRFTVAFDYDAKRMYLVPGRDFDRPDPYDRSGMWLFSDGDALRVVAVVPLGPAARAGLAPGDRIESIDGQPVAARPLSEWRARLRELPTGTRLTLATKRAGAERTVTLVLADIIPEHGRLRD